MSSVGKLFPHGLHGLIFDVDGVLFDSHASNAAYYNRILSILNLPPLSRESAKYCHMASTAEALDLIIPPHLREEAEKACRSIDYREQIMPLVTLTAGLLELLYWLKQWDMRMAVCTNRTNSVVDLLRHFSLEKFFHPVKTVDNSAPKPQPGGLLAIVREWGVLPGQVAFVGDSSVDRGAALAGGIPFWAFRNRKLSAQRHFADFFALIAGITPLVERS